MRKIYVVILLALAVNLMTSPLTYANSIEKSLRAVLLAIDCPDTITETTTPSCGFTLLDYTGLAVLSDVGLPPTVTQSPAPGTLVGVGITTITLTADDGSTNVSCSFDVEVLDTTSPTLTCPLDQIEIFDENCQFVLPDYTILGSASDSCSSGGSIPITQNPPAGTVISGTTTIFLLATDDAGNTGACTFNVIANDIMPPTIVCPEDREESTDENCVFVIPDYSAAATVNDNCGIPTMEQLPPPGTVVGLGVTTITLIANDGANTTPCTFDITVLDNSQPTMICPANQLEDFDENCELILPDYRDLADVIDACYSGPFLLTQDPVPGTVVTENTLVTLSAEDNAGNIGACTFVVMQNDLIPPTIACPENRIEEVNTADCMFTIPDYSSLAVAEDNCNALVTVIQTPIPGTILGVGTTSITLTANDGSNESLCTFNIIVQDTTGPNAICNAISIPLDAAGNAILTAADIDGGSTDFCGIESSSIDVTNFNCDNLGPNTVVLTLVDTNGNTSTCETTVTVVDPLFVCNQLPVALCGPVTVAADASCQGQAGAADFDAGSFDPDGLPTEITVSPEGPYPLGDTSVTLTINDGVFTATCTTSITVIDTTPPELMCLEDQLEIINGSCNFVLPDYRLAVTATDNCNALLVTQDPAPGTLLTSGINTITISANDGSNEAFCNFNVIIENNNTPTAFCQDITVQLDENGMASITPLDVDGGSSFICSDGAAMEINVDAFDCNSIGVNEVTLTVIEPNGVLATCVALVTVEDNIAPTVVCQDISVTLDQNGMASIAAQDIDGGSFDACGIDTTTLDITTFDCSMLGANQVTMSVTDIHGNLSTCVATVTVEDAILPVASCQSITIALDENGMATITPNDLDMGSSDNCGNFTTSLDISEFNCSNIGTNTVVFAVTDAEGNVATCEATVTVVDTIAPMIDCQPITIALDEDYNAVITVDDLGTITENCTISSTEISTTTFDCSNVGPNEVTVIITDQSGNEATCTTTVTIIEGIFPPNAVCQNVTVPLLQDGTATVQASAFDGGSTGVRCVDGFSIDISQFSCEDIGDPIQIEFTVFNAAGESDSCIAFVNVVDGLSPAITCPENQSVTSDGPYVLPDYFANGSAEAIDNCSTSLVTEQDPNPGTALQQGTHVITLTAIDNGGFESECEFIVVVDDLLGTQSQESLLDGIVLYPNPANQYVSISNPRFAALETISIFDITGRRVQEYNISEVNETISLDISNLESAAYMIVIATANKQVIKRFIKE